MGQSVSERDSHSPNSPISAKLQAMTRWREVPWAQKRPDDSIWDAFPEEKMSRVRLEISQGRERHQGMGSSCVKTPGQEKAAQLQSWTRDPERSWKSIRDKVTYVPEALARVAHVLQRNNVDFLPWLWFFQEHTYIVLFIPFVNQEDCEIS